MYDFHVQTYRTMLMRVIVWDRKGEGGSNVYSSAKRKDGDPAPMELFDVRMEHRQDGSPAGEWRRVMQQVERYLLDPRFYVQIYSVESFEWVKENL